MALLRRPINRAATVSRLRVVARIDFVSLAKEIEESARDTRVLRLDHSVSDIAKIRNQKISIRLPNSDLAHDFAATKELKNSFDLQIFDRQQ